MTVYAVRNPRTRSLSFEQQVFPVVDGRVELPNDATWHLPLVVAGELRPAPVAPAPVAKPAAVEQLPEEVEMVETVETVDASEEDASEEDASEVDSAPASRPSRSTRSKGKKK